MEYAQGNFSYDGLMVSNDDEIGDVASSLKYMSKQLNNSREYQKPLFPIFLMTSAHLLLP